MTEKQNSEKVTASKGTNPDERNQNRKKTEKMKAHQQSYENWKNGKAVEVSYFNQNGARVFIDLPTFWDATEKLAEIREQELTFDSKAAEDCIRAIL